jgi:predicted RNA-binding protein YlqC (UPF0109 family)
MVTWEVKNTHGLDVNWDEIPEASHEKVWTLSHLVLTTIRALVEHEDQVMVLVRANHRRAMFTVKVCESDVGLAVGARGFHADALRTLLIAASRKLKMHFDLDIGGPSGDADWSSG